MVRCAYLFVESQVADFDGAVEHLLGLPDDDVLEADVAGVEAAAEGEVIRGGLRELHLPGLGGRLGRHAARHLRQELHAPAGRRRRRLRHHADLNTRHIISDARCDARQKPPRHQPIWARNPRLFIKKIFQGKSNLRSSLRIYEK